MDRDRERLIGELAIELADRGAGRVRADDRVAQRVRGTRGTVADEGIAARVGIGYDVAGAGREGLGGGGGAGEQPPPPVDVGDRGELVVELRGAAGPPPHRREQSALQDVVDPRHGRLEVSTRITPGCQS